MIKYFKMQKRNHSNQKSVEQPSELSSDFTSDFNKLIVDQRKKAPNNKKRKLNQMAGMQQKEDETFINTYSNPDVEMNNSLSSAIVQAPKRGRGRPPLNQKPFSVQQLIPSL